MTNIQTAIHVDNLLNTGLPPATLETLKANSPVGTISNAQLISLVRNAAPGFINATADPRLGGLINQIGIAQDPLTLATNLINYKYNALGAASGFLGSPTTAVTASSDGVGFLRSFAGGAIYWHPACGAHEVHGPIRSKWIALGAERGFLGYPTSDQLKGRDAQSRGAFSHFQGGSIFWHPTPITVFSGAANTAVGANFTAVVQPASVVSASGVAARVAAPSLASPPPAPHPAAATASVTIPAASIAAASLNRDLVSATLAVSTVDSFLNTQGAQEVHGVIRQKYIGLGAEESILGYPTSDELPLPDGAGRISHFEAGDIYWHPTTGAAEIHGLIRAFWLAHGAERSAFGYPISDELVPDPRIGHVRPEVKRKPIPSLPPDVIKFPVEAAPLGFPVSAVNRAVTAPVAKTAAATSPAGAFIATHPIQGVAGPVHFDAAVSAPATLTAATNLAGSTLAAPNLQAGTAGLVNISLSEATLSGAVRQASLGWGEVSSEAPKPSQNRFQDFQNGVLFWFRGASGATQLSPWLQSADGTKMHWTAAEVMAAVRPWLVSALTGTSGLALAGMSVAGTDGYSYDGASCHNARHRLRVTLTGGMIGIVPMPIMFDLLVESAFEPLGRKIVVFVADWQPVLLPAVAQDPARQLHDLLDPVLWSAIVLQQLPDTDGGDPIAVLSVKTMPNGDVNVYIEPNLGLSLTAAIKDITAATQLNHI